MTSYLSIVSLVFAIFSVLVPVVGIVLISSKAPPAARSLGLAGCALLIIDGVIQSVYTVTVSGLVQRFGLALIGVVNAVSGIAMLAGVGLLIAAVCAGRRSPSPGPSGYPGPQQPYTGPAQYPPTGPSAY